MHKTPTTVGLVIGKFNPFHNGHEMLVREALQRTQRVILFMYDHPELHGIPTSERAMLIAKIIDDPRLEIIEAYNPPPAGRSHAHQHAHSHFLLRNLPADTAIDMVFCNAWYGKHAAAILHATLVHVDPKRQRHPISSSKIRKDSKKHMQHVHPLFAERLTHQKR